MSRAVVLLGSTGSVGTQALDVVARNPDRFRVVALAAAGNDVELLARQALDHAVEVVAVARASAAQDLQLAFYAAAAARGWSAGRTRLPRIAAGPDAAAEVAELACDVVLNAMTGSIGLVPTLAALRAGRVLALANKESLIVGGTLVKQLVGAGEDRLIPVDSEHSALAQCLRGGRRDEVRRLVLTASGGPFRGRRRADLLDVTVADALAHPTWDMGPVITVNSATLVNKGLEVIEAHLLFDVPFERIDVVVHPQSLVHSMVEFVDGSTLAQVSPPDMRLPIALALGWPDRVPDAQPPMDWTAAHTLEFTPLDDAAFPAVELARRVGAAGGTAPGVYNAANEEAVAAFLDGRLRFPQIVDTVAGVVEEHQREVTARPSGNSLSVDDVLLAESWARERAREIAGLEPAPSTSGAR
ncbi:MAG TPA: 1-deoxy-D-xylulose-5-phosphate reductoisomerase [Mycobacteriales bacterium]|nr:1-deoxy-D-xylulose-5-phosphate reductoisomerase [Mycobacteriales bacterium]